MGEAIPHGPLMRCVARWVADGTLLSVIKAWLGAPVVEREPSMKGRKGSVDVKTESRGHLGRSLGGDLKPGPIGIWLEDGVTPRQALAWNVGTCRLDAKGEVRRQTAILRCCLEGSGARQAP